MSAHTARRPKAFTPYGCRASRSAVDALAVAIVQTYHKRRGTAARITGALLTDVVAAFPSFAIGCFLRKMRGMGRDENLARWTGGFVRNRKVIISVDGQDGGSLEVIRDPLEGPPTGLAHFAGPLRHLHRRHEPRQSRGRWGIAGVSHSSTT